MQKAKSILNAIKTEVSGEHIQITLLSTFIVILLPLIDNYANSISKLAHVEKLGLEISLSLLSIIMHLTIVRELLSLKEVGLQRKGLLKSFLYSFIFVFLLRFSHLFGRMPQLDEAFLSHPLFILGLSRYVFAAFEEELIYRGVIFRVWEKRKGFIAALFVSSVLFGLLHVIWPMIKSEDLSLSRVTATGFFGPSFATIAYRTDNIIGLSLSHLLYNISIITVKSGETPEQTLPLVLLGFGVMLFSPIAVDFSEKFIFKAKDTTFKKINWWKYLAVLFVFFCLCSLLVYFDLL